jgi:hypothetical protein
VVPLRSIEAHLGDRRYSSYSFLTSAPEGVEWSASRPGRALPPEKEPPVPVAQEAGWAPEPVWTQRLEEKYSASVGDRTPAVQSVVRHYTDWATPALLIKIRVICDIWRLHGMKLSLVAFRVVTSGCVSGRHQRYGRTCSVHIYTEDGGDTFLQTTINTKIESCVY